MDILNVQLERNTLFPEYLGNFEVWVGNSPGDPSSAVEPFKCGEANYREWLPPEGLDTDPYVFWCGDKVREYVTVKQTGGFHSNGFRYLIISEIYIYNNTGSYPPLPPSIPPTPPELPPLPSPPPIPPSLPPPPCPPGNDTCAWIPSPGGIGYPFPIYNYNGEYTHVSDELYNSSDTLVPGQTWPPGENIVLHGDGVCQVARTRSNSLESFHTRTDCRKMCEQENENHGFYILQTIMDESDDPSKVHRNVNGGAPFGNVINFLCREGTDSTDCCNNPTNDGGRRMDESPSIQELVTLPLTIPHIRAIFADPSVYKVVLPQYVSSYVKDVLFSDPVDDPAGPIGLLPLPPTSGDGNTIQPCMVSSDKTRVDFCSMAGIPCESYYVEIMDGVLGSCKSTASGSRCMRAALFQSC